MSRAKRCDRRKIQRERKIDAAVRAFLDAGSGIVRGYVREWGKLPWGQAQLAIRSYLGAKNFHGVERADSIRHIFRRIR